MVRVNKSYEDLMVWQKSIDLTAVIYEITRSFPKEETYGLISQMRRCAVSIASNIAEGCARNNKGEFYQFLGIASGSLAELKTQLIIAERIQIVDHRTFAVLIDSATEIERMLSGLLRSIKYPTSPDLQLATCNN